MTNTQLDFPILPTAGYLRQSQLIPSIVPFSSATLWRKVNSGEFPRPYKLSERITAWKTEEVRAWLLSRTNGTIVGKGA